MLLHCYFFIIIQINWPFYRNHLGQIPLILALLYGNCPLIFKRNCSFSKHSVLFPRFIYRCFITLFSTRIFDYNFDTFCSCKFISYVLKSKYILLNYWILIRRINESDFIFDSVDLLYYNLQKISLSRKESSFINSAKWLENKNSNNKS